MIKFKDGEAPITKLWLGKFVFYSNEREGDPNRIGHVHGFSRNRAGTLFVRIKTDQVNMADFTENVITDVPHEQIVIGE